MLAGALVFTSPAADASPAVKWPTVPSLSNWAAFMGGASHSSYNADATAITPSNVSKLQQVWKWSTPASPNTGFNSLWASPTVVDGVVYVGAMDGYFYAIQESTRQTLWSDYLGLDTAKGSLMCGKQGYGIFATAAVANDPVTGTQMVYVNAPDGNLYALNAATGSTVWKSLIDTPSTTVNDYYSWSSPLVANNKIYVGINLQHSW